MTLNFEDSSKYSDPACTIRWTGIQTQLEDARADVLILMDCAYYPTSNTAVRRQGMLELIAASAGEDHVGLLGRSAFTRALTDQLRRRAVQPFKEPFSAAELHAKLMSSYPGIVRSMNETEIVMRLPAPLSIQLSGTKTLPSIFLAPLQHGQAGPRSPDGTQISITFRLADDAFNVDAWAEWLRLMPAGITEARVDGPYRNTL